MGEEMPVGGEKHTFARFPCEKKCSCYRIEYGYNFWPKKNWMVVEFME